MVLFFVAGQIYPFEAAAAILVISTIVSISYTLWYENRIPMLPFVSAIIVIILGCITVFFHKPDAIIFADTIYYFMIAIGIALGLYFNKLILKTLFNPVFAMSDEGWRLLSWRWLTILLIAGSANEAVRIIATPEFWIDFRAAKIGVLMLFAFYQFRLSRRYRIPEESNSWGLRTVPIHNS